MFSLRSIQQDDDHFVAGPGAAAAGISAAAGCAAAEAGAAEGAVVGTAAGVTLTGASAAGAATLTGGKGSSRLGMGFFFRASFTAACAGFMQSSASRLPIF